MDRSVNNHCAKADYKETEIVKNAGLNNRKRPKRSCIFALQRQKIVIYFLKNLIT